MSPLGLGESKAGCAEQICPWAICTSLRRCLPGIGGLSCWHLPLQFCGFPCSSARLNLSGIQGSDPMWSPAHFPTEFSLCLGMSSRERSEEAVPASPGGTAEGRWCFGISVGVHHGHFLKSLTFSLPVCHLPGLLPHICYLTSDLPQSFFSWS